MRLLIGGEEMEKEVGGHRESSDRHLIADAQIGEQFGEADVVADLGAVAARELANAGDDRVGDVIGRGVGQWLILGAANARWCGRYG